MSDLRGTERSSDLLKLTELVNCGARVQIQAVWFQMANKHKNVF